MKNVTLKSDIYENNNCDDIKKDKINTEIIKLNDESLSAPLIDNNFNYNY